MAQGSYDQDDVNVKGEHSSDEDGIKIDAIIDSEGVKRLAVDADITTTIESGIPTLGNNLRYDDMNASNGGVARNTFISSSWVTVYNYSGAGLLFGFNMNLDAISKVTWFIRLLVDGVDVFNGTVGIKGSDLFLHSIYDIEGPRLGMLGFNFSDHDVLRWKSPNNYPMAYSSSVEIKVKKESGDKKFFAGLVCVTKN